MKEGSQVRSFLERDDNSIMSPGKKDHKKKRADTLSICPI